MQPMLVISYAGQYNPYMIADVTSAVTDSNLNIVDVQQNALHGLSILTMIAETLAPGDCIDRAHERLGFDYVFANELEIVDSVVTGRLKRPIIDKEAKGKILQEIVAKEGLVAEEVVAVGVTEETLDAAVPNGTGGLSREISTGGER